MIVFDTTIKCEEMPEKADMDFMKELLFGNVQKCITTTEIQ